MELDKTKARIVMRGSKMNPSIEGVGWSEQSKRSGVTPLNLAIKAAKAAIQDAGINTGDVDAVVTFGRRDGPSSLHLAAALGLGDLRYFLDIDGGGFSSQTAVIAAAQAVESGLAKNVLVFRAMNGRSGPHRFGGSSQQQPVDIIGDRGHFSAGVGVLSPATVFAFAAQSYLQYTGATSVDLGRIAVQLREHALLNPRAVMKEALTLEQHQESEMISDPLRKFDCALETDGACALLVSAQSMYGSQRPRVEIRASAVSALRGAVGGFGLRDEKSFFSSSLAKRLYQRAGITPKHIGLASLYDCFTYSLLIQLEEFGWAAPGEGPSLVASGEIGLTGEIPVNTHGGLLSEAYLQGLGHVAEAVQQLRGEAGARQIRETEFALTSGHGGAMGGALILQKVVI